MKKIILLALLAITLTSCNLLEPAKPAEHVESTTKNYKAKSIEYITGDTITRSIGLYKVTLQDGREVLLYNDSRGVAMVQLIK